MPSDAELADIYSKENYHDLYYEEARAEGRYAASARLLKRICGIRRALLDFGCGSGSFMIAASREGFEVVGVEREQSAVQNARDKTGLPVTTLADLQASERRFEMIHLGDVLEHLPDPAGTMRTLQRLLTADGLFFVEGPLQANASLVYYVARMVRALKTAVGLAARPTIAPTHLVLTTAQAQRRFFMRTLGLRCIHFEVAESGWPYCLEVPTPLGVAGVARKVIGLAAIGVSFVVRGWGNRFAAVLEAPD